MARTILVIKLGALGDIFMNFEAFQALRSHHAGDRIVLLTRPPFVALAKRMPWFDEVWTDTGPKFWQVGRWLALRRRLREAGFSRVYDLQSNDRTAFYFRLLGNGPVEWCGPVKGATFRYTKLNDQPVHAAERALRYLELAGVKRAGPADFSWLDGSLDGLGLPAKFVVLVPGCAPHRPYKRWPASSYAALARRLQAEGFGVVAIGTGADRESIEAICREAPEVLNLCGKTEIGQVAALARVAAGVVGNDTGPVHITAAAGAPTLVLMSKVTDPVRLLPRGPDVGFIKKDAIDEITVDEVETALRLRATN